MDELAGQIEARHIGPELGGQCARGAADATADIEDPQARPETGEARQRPRRLASATVEFIELCRDVTRQLSRDRGRSARRRSTMRAHTLPGA